MKTPSLPLFVFSAIVLLFLPSVLVAQTTAARPDRGIMPGASYSVSDIENISLTNGNVQLTIPLASLPPIAGGKLKFTLNAVYNSKLWNITRQEERRGFLDGCPSWVIDTPQLSDLGGWRIPVGYQIVFRNAHDDFDYEMPAQPPTPDCETDVQEQARLQSQYYRAILITPDGAEHELRPTDNYATYGGTRSYLLNYYKDTPNTVGSPMRYYSFDGSFLYAVINPSSNPTSWTVYMNDGTRIVQSSNGIQRITDTNGNSIKIFSDANGTHIQDEHTSREIRVYDNKVWYKTVTGLDQSIDIVMGSTQVQGKIYQVNDWSPTGGETGGGFVCQRNELLTTAVPVIREIVFPATEPGVSPLRYSFSYNSDTTTTATDNWRLSCGMAPQSYTRTVSNGMGELSQVTTPTGAVIKYSYSKSAMHNFSLDVNDIPRATVTQKQVIHDGITDTWTYDINEATGSGGVVTAPDGSVTAETCYPHDPAWAQFFGYANTLGGLVYRSSRSNKEVVERHWTTLPFSGANTGIAGNSGIATFNPVVDVEYLTLLDDTPNHNPLKMSAKKFQYDFNGNLTQQIDYDWFNPSLVSRDAAGVPTGVPASATVLRTTNYTHYNQAATASSANVYAKRSLTTVTPLILNALQQTTLGPSIVQLSYDGQAYGVAPTVGNLTTKSVWANLDNKWITTSSTYDVYGNVVATTDGRGKVTQYFFDDTTHALPTRVVVDPQNATGTQTTTTVYDYATGLVTSVTDPNNALSTIGYTNQLLNTIDPFGRPGVTIGPLVNAGGVNQHHRVTNTYEDHLRRVVVASDLNAENDKLLKTRTTADMLGRPVLTEQTEDGTNYTLYTLQAYAQGGRISFASSVMRTGVASTTDSWTRVTNDSLGRPIEVATFGGATQPPNTGTTATASGTVTTVYDGNFTTVTDQAGKLRRSLVDAVGRLIRVDEPDGANNLGSTAAPVQPTSYAYDVFGNLTTVTQGSQTRTFTYDSLSRLRQAVNPESGTVSYQYDDNGNLLVKTDARTVSTHFEYDALNRLTRRWYNGSNAVASTTHNSPSLPFGVGATDEAKFKYDLALTTVGAPIYTIGAAKGRLVAVTHGAGTNGDYYAYDALGRATLKIQQTGSVNYQVTASYNLSGAIGTLTYPSGHTVTNTYDQAGRLAALSGNLGDGSNRSYASGILYAPTGGLVKEQFGANTALYHKSIYNSRGQLFDTRLSSVNDLWDWNRGRLILYYSGNHQWGQSGTDNNGNVLFAETWIPPENATLDQAETLSEQSYEYDSLNRLKSVTEQRISVSNGWVWQPQFKQSYNYDRYGNRTIKTAPADTWGTGINNRSFEVQTATNRLYSPGDLALTDSQRRIRYDATGNQTKDTYTGYGNANFDAENRIITIQDNLGGTTTYNYNADGQRTRRNINNQETWQVYGFGGELLAEYAANGAAGSPQKEYGYRNGELLISASRPSCGAGYQGTKSWGATSPALGHLVGHQEGSDWVTTVSGDAAGHVSYGPYDNTFGQGYHNAKFLLQIDNTSGSDVVATVDVVTGLGATILAQRQIRRNEFSAANQWQWFTLEFDNPCFGLVEARVYWHDTVNMRLNQVTITGVNSAGATVQWLVTDHLGTPRLIVDQTGTLAHTKRHDYLPFGEELFAPAGGRTAALGYTGGDNVRQQFTQKERDVETGLDYFGARYFASVQGRFTSTDPLMASAYVGNPQTWNRYTYALNNPLKYVDPDGMEPKFRDFNQLTEDERKILNNSTMTFGNGKNAKTLSGEALYNHMKEHEKKQLAGFLNMTAGLASITFKDGTRAIDYVKGVTGGSRERIYANVDPALKTQMETLGGKDHEAGQRFIGPSGQAVKHANAGINYDVTFRENIPDGPIQLSFASKENFARMDMDMDEHCQNCGDKSAEAAHIADGIKHRFTGGTNPEYIHKVLTARKINPSYDIKK